MQSLDLQQQYVLHTTRMRLYSLCMCLLVSGAALLTAMHAAQAAEADERAVLDVVDTLFIAMHDKDESTLRSLFLPEARLGTDDVEGWIAQVTSTERVLSEQTFNETVFVDGDLAMAWTPYTLSIDGVFHHCGVDAFILRRAEGQWKILQIDDTRRTEGCES